MKRSISSIVVHPGCTRDSVSRELHTQLALSREFVRRLRAQYPEHGKLLFLVFVLST